jgi:hypothetical protein
LNVLTTIQITITAATIAVVPSALTLKNPNAISNLSDHMVAPFRQQEKRGFLSPLPWDEQDYVCMLLIQVRKRNAVRIVL